MTWWGISVGLLGILAFIVGLCYRQIQDVLTAIASRIRYGKLPPPTEEEAVVAKRRLP